MNGHRLVDVRTPIATSPHARVELGQDGSLHVITGNLSVQLERAMCEELTTTLARAMVWLAERDRSPAVLHLVPGTGTTEDPSVATNPGCDSSAHLEK